MICFLEILSVGLLCFHEEKKAGNAQLRLFVTVIPPNTGSPRLWVLQPLKSSSVRTDVRDVLVLSCWVCYETKF